MDWKHKDEWTVRRNSFCVVVSRHEAWADAATGLGPHRWCVYAYIYPGHSHFAAFDLEGDMYQGAAAALPLHCGASLFKVHRDSARCCVNSVQVGADYNHLYDDDFTHMATREDAYRVFADAERLVAWLDQGEASA